MARSRPGPGLARLLLLLLLTVLAEGSDGYERVVLSALSRPADVVVFGKDIHSTRFTTSWTDVPMKKPPHTFHDHRLSAFVASGRAPQYQCAFGADMGTKVNATTVNYQIVTCPHPPEPARDGLYGQPVTLVIGGEGGKYMNSTAVYERPVEARPKYNYCACLLMWYRAEFLLEWLLYHSVVHGLQKVFIYDNDSGVDELEQAVRFLGTHFNVERVPWLVHKIQPAYHGHCAVKAGRECEWVSFTDIDEFVHVAPREGGHLGNYLRKLGPKVGALEMRMVTTSAGNPHLLRKPAGGVLRNYRCTGNSTNWKSIVRPRGLHRSLTNAVHYYAMDAPAFYNIRLTDRAAVKLYHFKNQAWEIFMRKYERRASPATKKFRLHGGRAIAHVLNPDPKWQKVVIHECSDPEGSPLFALLQQKITPIFCHSPSCDAEFGDVAVLAGTGGPGSGIRWIEQKLVQQALKVAAVPVAGNVSLDHSFKERKAVRLPHLLHHRRHPLGAISSLALTMPINAALGHWVMANAVLDITADWSYRVEDVQPAEICRQVGMPKPHCQGFPTLRPRKSFVAVGAPPTAPVPVTWEALRAADPYVAKLALAMASGYGYNVSEGKRLMLTG